MRLSEHPVLTEHAIQTRVAELAAEVSAGSPAEGLVLVIVLKGAMVFGADLMRQLSVPVEVEFIRARSYADTQSTGAVSITVMPETPLSGKHVVVVEDILDTGHTTEAVLARLREQDPASLSLCVLLDKPSRRHHTVTPDYVGFTVEDRFVVGYGLDYNQRYRNLPAVYQLERD
jgi:hypoxanthine phosphoribosyltransferase